MGGEAFGKARVRAGAGADLKGLELCVVLVIADEQD